MSAWIVDKRHIDFLVQAILRSEAVPEAGTDADFIGRVLWDENHMSVNYRYNEQEPTPEYRFESIELPADAAYLLKQVACYQYQTCEHPSWDQSDAYAWTQRLREMWEGSLGGGAAARSLPAYRAAPWGIGADYSVAATRDA